MSKTPRPPRADALQNRVRILAAARECFAADGLEASMDDIAREAGVAVGTLYHHFGTKDALLEGIVQGAWRRSQNTSVACSTSLIPGSGWKPCCATWPNSK